MSQLFPPTSTEGLMKTLNDFLTELSYGELADTYAGVDGGGTIDPVYLNRIVHFINDGLLRLYSKFVISEKNLILETFEGKSTYLISSEYAESNYDSESGIIPYIKDNGMPYRDDLVKILSVYDKWNKSLPLNDPDRADSLFTSQWNVLNIPWSYETGAFNIRYQSRHPILLPDVEKEQKLELPEVLMSALTAFVAYRLYLSINTAESRAKAEDFLGSFNSICDEAMFMDLVNSSYSATKTIFEKRGFV